MPHRQQGRGGPGAQHDIDAGTAEFIADPDRSRAWTLLVDGIPQSHVDLDDPGYLEFEYMRRFGHLVDLAAPGGRPLRVLHLGGGGLTLARYVAATRPGSRQLVVEADAALAELVRRKLPFGPGGRRGSGVRVRVGDARAVAEQVPAASYDLVIADVFTGARTPEHLTSAEFVATLARLLTPSGIYTANVGDGPPLAHSRSRVATARSVFPRACLIADAAVLRGRRSGNLVIAGAQRGLPVSGLVRRVASDPFPGRLVQGGELDRFVAGARPITDAQTGPPAVRSPDLFAVGAVQQPASGVPAEAQAT